MRVFIGIKVGWMLQAEIHEWQRNHAYLPARMIPPEDLHVTLVPPWDVDDVDAVIARIRAVVGHISPIPLTFSTVETGPTPEHPRLVWARAEPEVALTALHHALTAAFGVRPEHAFTPHITLARASTSTIPVIRESCAWSCIVDNVTLYRTTGGGAGYTVLGQVVLPIDQ